MTIKTGKTPCGFCLTNVHQYCPAAIRQKDGEEIVLCPCGCKPDIKCLVCGNRTSEEVNPETWVCIDAGECMREVDRKRQQAKDRMFPQGQPEISVRKNRPQCGCDCGETTGGGKFRPGHDSRFVSNVVARVKSGEITAEQAKREVGSISAGLLQKLAGKV